MMGVERMEECAAKRYRPFFHNRSQFAKLLWMQNQVNIGDPGFGHVEVTIAIGIHADWL